MKVAFLVVMLSVESRCMMLDPLVGELSHLQELLAKFQEIITKISSSPQENKIAQAQSDIDDLIDKARLAQAADKNAESIELYQQGLDKAAQFNDNGAINDLAIEIYTRQLPLIAQTSNLDQLINAGIKASEHVGLMVNRVTRNSNLTTFVKLRQLINSLKTIADIQKAITKNNALTSIAKILVNGQASAELMQDAQFSAFKPHFNKLFKMVHTKLVMDFFDTSNEAQMKKLNELIEATK